MNTKPISVALVVVALASCKPTKTDVKSADAGGSPPSVAAPTAQPFGTGGLGFVSWLESQGNFVIVHQFDRDTNSDGELDPRFGDHGEPEGDWPSVWTYGLPEGDAEQWDEFVTSDPMNRWAVLRRGDVLTAVSASKRWTLEGADTRPDPSPCAPARQASIDPTGTWLVFVRTNPDRAVVKHLGNGQEREVAAQGLLWRADAMPRGWVMLREVLEDSDGNGTVAMPHREGTCICRWCSRFASSVGSGRFVGDRHNEVVVDADGNRTQAPPAPIPVGPNAIWSMSQRALFDARGQSIALPAQCSFRLLPLGSDVIVLGCSGTTQIWNPTSGESVATPLNLQAVDAYALPASGWVVAATVTDEGRRRIGRLNLADAGFEEGPPALRIGPVHPSGWRLVADDQQVYAFDTATGSSSPVAAEHLGDLEGLVAKSPAGWVVVAPLQPKPAVVERRPEFVAANGCFVEASERTRPEPGPWRWRCP